MRAALYARYSTDNQREASIEDQVRVCEQLVQRHGFTVVARFEDKAISAGTTQRPGYQAMMAAARRGDFDVIVAEDVSRLWRNMAEQSPRLAELSDLGVAVVSHDLDTRQESSGLLGAVQGASNEHYRREIGRRTRRGLEGRARNGAASGGKAYGYKPASQSGTGQIEIHVEQAEVVRWIFQKYADGWSPIRISSDLNRRGIPSPGVTLKRADKVPAWSVSTIAGDARRGLGILNCETYHGVKVWGRTARVRSAADSRHRRCIVKPRSAWIVQPMERLRIVSEDLWQRVKARQRTQSTDIGVRIAEGMQRSRRKSAGKRPQYLFSGLLRCVKCGSRFVMGDSRSYVCAGNLYGRGCENRLRVRRTMLQDRILTSVKRDLLQPEVLDEIRRRLVKAITGEARRQRPPSSAPRIRVLKAEIENLTDAIAAGMLRASPALADRLRSAEDELAILQVQPRATVTSVDEISALLATYPSIVADLENVAATDMPKARTGLQKVVGDVIGIQPSACGTFLEALIGFGIEAEAVQVSGLPISVVPRAGANPIISVRYFWPFRECHGSRYPLRYPPRYFGALGRGFAELRPRFTVTRRSASSTP